MLGKFGRTGKVQFLEVGVGGVDVGLSTTLVLESHILLRIQT